MSLDHVGLADNAAPPHLFGMFMVTEADADAIRTAFDEGGEFSAAVELRRRFPGITDNLKARECARTIVGWKAEPLPSTVTSLRPGKRR